MTDKQYFCTVANDGVAVCVCKYRPCEKLKRKEQECEELKEELNMNKHFVHDSNIESSKICKRLDHYKKALEEIEKLIPKFNSSTECAYGDFDCENCSSLDEEIVCGYKLKKIILDIINNVKRQ